MRLDMRGLGETRVALLRTGYTIARLSWADGPIDLA